jgi:hypothetical protein
MHVISPSHVPQKQDGQGKKVQEIIFSRALERRLTSKLEIFFGRLFGFHMYELHEAG